MSRQITKTVYTFEELSDDAKENARAWYRQQVFSDSNDWDHVIDDAVECARIIGIDISSHPVKTFGGSTVQEPDVQFSGFSSQGDGALFEGRYAYAKGGLKAIKSYAPQDAELHRIAKALQDTQRKRFYKLTASCVQRGRYTNSSSMSVTVDHPDYLFRSVVDAEEEIRESLRSFADWIYRQLEKEYEYQNSNESVDENIIANGYEFDEEGKVAA